MLCIAVSRKSKAKFSAPIPIYRRSFNLGYIDLYNLITIIDASSSSATKTGY
jgi:hypothetical protein